MITHSNNPLSQGRISSIALTLHQRQDWHHNSFFLSLNHCLSCIMKKVGLILFVAGFLGSCAPIVISRAPFPTPAPESGERRGELSLQALEIPNGHMPPPGSCRIWYPGRPAGQQPPPFKCGAGRLNIPLGTFLVQRLDGKFVQVDEYDSRRPDYVVRSGRFQLSN